MDKLTEIVTAQCALNDAKAAANRQRFNRFSKTRQKASGMIDPIRLLGLRWRVGSSSPRRPGQETIAFREPRFQDRSTIQPPFYWPRSCEKHALSHHPKEPTRT